MKNQLSFGGKIWKFGQEIYSLNSFQEIIFQKLGLRSSAEIQHFINPQLENMRDPFELSDMENGVSRTIQAINNKERIMIVGDFDADGITATVILVNTLQKCGANVSYFIPDRVNDSHGLKKEFMKNFAEKKVKLVITCDCGSNDFAEIAYGKTLGLETIITDHHGLDPARNPTAAVALINCQRSQNQEEKNLSGSAMALKFSLALLSKFFEQNPTKITEIADPLFEIATIGIISDCVKLVGDNRIIAKYGLSKMLQTSWNGLRTLLEKLKIKEINEETIGFLIAPHLNAASRLGNVLIAVQLFLGNPAKNKERVDYLINLNRERKIQTDNLIFSAEKQIITNQSSQLFFDKNWNQGILGLAASHFTEKLNVPIICCTVRKKDNMLSASCRAPEGFSIIDGLKNCSDFFDSFGGHSGAGGFIANLENLEKIRENLNKYFAQKKVSAPQIKNILWLSPTLVSFDLNEFLKFLSPFGEGNPSPVFGIKKVKITDIFLMGKDRNHAKFSAKKEDNKFSFVAFFADNFIKNIQINDEIDILFNLSENHWQGETSLQIKLVDARKSSLNN